MTILFSALMDASGTCSHLAAARMDSRWRCRSWYASRIFTGELQDLALPSSTLCHAMKGMLEWCAPDDCFLCWDRSEGLLLKRFFPKREIFCMTGLPQSTALPQLRDLACFVGYPPPLGAERAGKPGNAVSGAACPVCSGIRIPHPR